MFKNVVSTQDLLSDSQRTNYSSDSALFSLSQRQHSQNEFSQVRTQDLFTQNQTGSGSQSESSFPQTRKVSMYDKWMSKGAMFKKDQSTHNKTAGSAAQSFHQQCQNTIKETNDRELLQQVVNIVQDCNKEVKCTLSAVKEKLESQCELSGEKLGETMKAFLEDIWKHEDRMLQAILERNQSTEKLHELEKQLAVKDAEIKQLQIQQEERGKTDDLKQVAKAVRQEMLSPQLAVENKLMEILEVTRGASEQQSEQLNQYKHQMTAHTKQYNEWKTFNQRLIKDMEKRLQKDILNLRKDLQKQEQEWKSSLQDQLSEASTVYMQELEKLIDRVLSESTRDNSKQGIDRTAITSIVASMKSNVQNAIQKQTKSMEKSIQDMLRHQLQKQQQQLQTLHNTLLADVSAGIESVTERYQDKENDELIKPLTVPVFEEKFEEYHSDLKHQLEEMHKKHVQEVLRIQKEMKLQDSTPAPGKTSTPFTTSVISRNTSSLNWASGSGYFPKTVGYQLQRRKEMARISPMTQLDRSNLFSRAKPSPLLAAVPREQLSQSSSLVNTKNAPSDSDPEVTFPQQPAQSAESCSKANQGKKRRKNNSGHGKKKCSAKKVKSQSNGRNTEEKSLHKPQIQTAAAPKSQNTAEQMLVYNFSQEQSPDKPWWQVEEFQLKRSRYKRSQFCSPGASTASFQSSPAVSIGVDNEFVVVRRSRWQTSATSERVSSRGNRMPDLLSTPSMESSMTQRSGQQDQVETGRGDSRTRNSTKRTL